MCSLSTSCSNSSLTVLGSLFGSVAAVAAVAAVDGYRDRVLVALVKLRKLTLVNSKTRAKFYQSLNALKTSDISS